MKRFFLCFNLFIFLSPETPCLYGGCSALHKVTPNFLKKFIVDLVALNDYNEFERSFHEIYSPYLRLKKENLGYLAGSFLDLMITILDKIFCTKLFEKSDSFSL